MTMHCNISQVDGQEELRKKNQIHTFCFFDAISCQRHKIFISINRFKHVLNSKTTSNFTGTSGTLEKLAR